MRLSTRFFGILCLGIALLGTPISSSEAQGLPDSLKDNLEGKRTLYVSFDKGEFRFRLVGFAPTSSEDLSFDLLRSEVLRPQVVEGDMEGSRKAWIWSAGGSNSWFSTEDRTLSSGLQLLVEAGEAQTWNFEFAMRGKTASGGTVTTLEMSSYRPLVIRTDPGIGLVGCAGGKLASGGYEGLLGASGRIGFFLASAEDAEPRLRADLEKRLFPPEDLIVDGYFRSSLNHTAATLLVRDLSLHPRPHLALKMHGEGQVLGVQELPSQKSVLYKVEGDRLNIHPGPGPGPRFFVIHMSGPGAETHSREFSLPFLTATESHTQKPGVYALDAVSPGSRGSFSFTGAAVSDKELANNPYLKVLWGDRRVLAFEGSLEAPRLAISKTSTKERPRLPDLMAKTVFNQDWMEITRLTFSLPPDSRWMELGLLLPPDATHPKSFVDGEEVPLVSEELVENDRGEKRLPLRCALRPEADLVVQYQRKRPLGGASEVSLSLPVFFETIGKLVWNVEAPEEFRFGVPVWETSEEKSSETTSSAVGASLSLGGAFDPEPVAKGLFQAHENLASVSVGDIEPPSAFTISLAVVPLQSLALGHSLLFLGGMALALWGLRGAQRQGKELAFPAVGAFFFFAGMFVSRVGDISSPWFPAFLSGALFAAILWALVWGLAEAKKAMLEAYPEAPGAQKAGPGPSSGSGGAKAEKVASSSEQTKASKPSDSSAEEK